MEGAGEAGVVVFTMGFIFNTEVVPASVIRNLMTAFARLPQRVGTMHSGTKSQARSVLHKA